MFEHSVRVPRLYKEAAKKLREAVESGGSSFGSQRSAIKHKNVKAVFALAVESFRNSADVDALLQEAGLLRDEPRLDPWLARVLVTELLWRDRQIAGDSKPVTTVLRYANTLRQLKRQQFEKHPPTVTKDAMSVQRPRFVRVNTLKMSLAEAVETFRLEEWLYKTKDYSSTAYEDFLSSIDTLATYEFMADIHVKDLLIFPPRTEFYNYSLYNDGSILLQDKASCLPVVLLNPEPNSVVLDMCAAPGMKTSYLAARMNNEGIIYAVEKDERRYNTLLKMLESAQVTCVKPMNQDVLKVNADDCPDVEYILVDPSCSGSGMTNRIKMLHEETPSDDRLSSLSRFQTIILKHALGHFPKAKRVVYSTCSIYPQENEKVVEEVLQFGHNFKLVNANKLLKFPSENESRASVKDKCLYFTPEKDKTNGFFIAVFERNLDYVTTTRDKKRKNCESTDRHEGFPKEKKRKDKNVLQLDNSLQYEFHGNGFEEKKRRKHCESTDRHENLPKEKKRKDKNVLQLDTSLQYESHGNGLEEKKRKKNCEATDRHEGLPKEKKRKDKNVSQLDTSLQYKSHGNGLEDKKRRKHCELIDRHESLPKEKKGKDKNVLQLDTSLQYESHGNGLEEKKRKKNCESTDRHEDLPKEKKRKDKNFLQLDTPLQYKSHGNGLEDKKKRKHCESTDRHESLPKEKKRKDKNVLQLDTSLQYESYGNELEEKKRKKNCESTDRHEGLPKEKKRKDKNVLQLDTSLQYESYGNRLEDKKKKKHCESTDKQGGLPKDKKRENKNVLQLDASLQHKSHRNEHKDKVKK